MSKLSWITTLAPLAIALMTTLKAFFTGNDLTPEEIQLIQWLVTAFIGSGVIGKLNLTKKTVGVAKVV